jgi:hypothetical protein
LDRVVPLGETSIAIGLSPFELVLDQCPEPPVEHFRGTFAAGELSSPFRGGLGRP